jgi:hypothetical protein
VQSKQISEKSAQTTCESRRLTGSRLETAYDTMTRLEMTVDSHFPRLRSRRLVITRSEIVFPSAFSSGHRIVPVFNIRSDQIKDSGQRRDEEVSDIVFRIDVQ